MKSTARTNDTGDDAAGRVMAAFKAASALRDEYDRTGDPRTLFLAIAGYEEVLEDPDFGRTSPGIRAASLGLLASALRQRYEMTDASSHLDRAVECLEAARKLMADPAIVLSLTKNLERRYERRGEVADLDRLVALYEELLDAPLSSPDEEVARDGLANALLDRYAATATPSDLERSERIFTDADLQRSVEPKGWAARGRGAALLQRYERGEEPADLDQAVEVLQRAVEETPSDSPELATGLKLLGASLALRYHRHGGLVDLERTVEITRRAVAATSSGSSSWAAASHNLAAALVERYDRLGNSSDLDASIEVLEEILRHVPVGAPSRRMHLATFGTALATRAVRQSRPDDLDRAIEIIDDAFIHAPAGSRERETYMHNLAAALVKRHERLRGPHDIARAISLLEDSVQHMPEGSHRRALRLNSLGLALQQRHEQSRDPQDLLRAFAAFRTAGEQAANTASVSQLMAYRNWAQLAGDNDAWSEAAKACRLAFECAERLSRSQFSRRHREAVLREMTGVPARAAHAMLMAGEPREAAVALERGRAILLTEALERDRVDLLRLANVGYRALAERYNAAAERVRRLESSEPDTNDDTALTDWNHRVGEARDALAAVIAEVQAVPTFEHFFNAPSFTDVTDACQTAPIVYLAAGTSEGLALIVRSEGDVQHIPLPQLRAQDLTYQATTFVGTAQRRTEDFGRWLHEISTATRWLWDTAMGPVVDALGHGSRATLVATGLLGLFPLHAAWLEDEGAPRGRRYALDDVLFTYAPGARSLDAARRIAAALPRPDSVLAVEGVATPGDAGLHHAIDEVDAVVETFARQRRLSEGEASESAVVRQLANHGVWHFACHGRADIQAPLESSLFVGSEERLTLRTLLGQASVAARLAVLSACETARSGVAVVDEVVGLSSGFLQVGAAGVIGSLWPVPEVSTTLLMSRFYQLWRQSELDPAEAFRRAQQWVRTSTNAEKRDRFPQLGELSGAGLTGRAKTYWEGGRTHAHPYYWAGFTYVGA